MKKKILGAAVLVVGTGAALAAAAIPAASVTASPEPVSGIIRQAEANATADPIAEKGMQEAVRRCMARAGFDYAPPTSELTLDLNGAHRIQTAHGRRRQSQRFCFSDRKGQTDPPGRRRQRGNAGCGCLEVAAEEAAFARHRLLPMSVGGWDS